MYESVDPLGVDSLFEYFSSVSFVRPCVTSILRQVQLVVPMAKNERWKENTMKYFYFWCNFCFKRFYTLTSWKCACLDIFFFYWDEMYVWFLRGCKGSGEFFFKWFQGSKLGGGGSRGLPWMLLGLPQINAGSPNMYCLTYRTLLWSLWRPAIGLPGKNLNFEPWIPLSIFWKIVRTPWHYFCHWNDYLELKLKINNMVRYAILWYENISCF